MAEYLLQTENVTAIQEIIFGKSMAKRMRRTPHPCYSDPSPVSPEHLLDTTFGKRNAVFT